MRIALGVVLLSCSACATTGSASGHPYPPPYADIIIAALDCVDQALADSIDQLKWQNIVINAGVCAAQHFTGDALVSAKEVIANEAVRRQSAELVRLREQLRARSLSDIDKSGSTSVRDPAPWIRPVRAVDDYITVPELKSWEDVETRESAD